MANVLAVLATNRRGGFTATMLKAACEGAEGSAGVKTEIACLARYDFKPCLSSFWCARNKGVGCVLPDDMGKKGEGVLFGKVRDAHGMLLATPVHTWGPSALAHTFWERLYPFLYSDGINGLPFGALACATNQGFQRQAIEEIAKWSFGRSNLYLGGVAAHVMDAEKALEQARELGRKVGEAALKDEAEGRCNFTDGEKFAYFQDKPWKVLDPYLDNVTEGSFQLEGSLPDRAFGGAFRKSEALDLVGKARDEFGAALGHRQKGELEKADQALMRASAYWTRATWKEYVEDYISKRDDVPPYREEPSREQE